MSLANVTVPKGCEVSVVVVDNDCDEAVQEIVECAARGGISKFLYLKEEIKGIPFARNKTLTAAIDLGADWIAFIDDDEFVDQDWLCAYLRAMSRFPADAYIGPVRSVYPEATPSWYPKRNKENGPTGTNLSGGYTSNAMININLISPGGLGLRFDERFRFTGGEDKDFFKRAVELGLRIVSVDDAVVFEDVPENRISLKWVFSRRVWVKANSAQEFLRKKGWLLSLIKYSPKIVARSIFVILLLVVCLLMKLFGRVRYEKCKYLMIDQLAHVVGYVRGLLNWLPQPYLNTDGG